jgi:hypothetical protein
MPKRISFRLDILRRGKTVIRIANSIAFALLGLGVAFAQIKLPTVDEALELSSKTGRPIFAMAGQET